MLLARQARSNVANHCLDVPTAAPSGNPNHLPAKLGQYPVAGEVLAAQFAPGVNVVIAIDLDIGVTPPLVKNCTLRSAAG